MGRIDSKAIQLQSSLIVVYSLCSTVLSLFVYGYSARHYDLGNLSSGLLVLSIAWYAVNVLDFGMSTFAVKEVVIKRRELEAFYYVGALKIGFSIVVSSVLGLLLHNHLKSLFYGSVITLTLFTIQQLNIGLRTAGYTSRPGMIAVIEKFSTSLILILNFNFDWKLDFLQVYSFGVLFSLLASLRFSQIRFISIKFGEIRSVFKKSLSLGVSSSIGQAKLLDVNFLAIMIGSVASAPYILVARWASSINLFSNAFSQAILPVLAKNSISKTDFEELRRASLWLALAITSSVMIFFFSPLIIEIILGGKYNESVVILRILSLATIFTTLIQPLTVFIQTQSKPSFVTLSLCSGLIAQMLIIFVYSDSTGASSAAIGYLLGQFVTFVLLLIFALPLRDFLKYEQ
jgi:O-antigen/teichoic acid export membrane protein